MRILAENSPDRTPKEQKIAKQNRKKRARLRLKRIEDNVCIDNKAHGLPFKAKRCAFCWNRHLETQRLYRKKEK